MTRVEALLIISLVVNVMMFRKLTDMISTNELMRGFYNNIMIQFRMLEDDSCEDEE